MLTKQIDAYIIIIIVPSEERSQKLFKKVVDKVVSVWYNKIVESGTETVGKSLA